MERKEKLINKIQDQDEGEKEQDIVERLGRGNAFKEKVQGVTLGMKEECERGEVAVGRNQKRKEGGKVQDNVERDRRGNVKNKEDEVIGRENRMEEVKVVRWRKGSVRRGNMEEGGERFISSH